jgi:hypothetical protein
MFLFGAIEDASHLRKVFISAQPAVPQSMQFYARGAGRDWDPESSQRAIAYNRPW